MSENKIEYVRCSNKELIKNFEARCPVANSGHKLRLEQINPEQLYIYDMNDNRHFIFNQFASYDTISIPGSPDKIRVDTMKAVCSARLRYLCFVTSTSLQELSRKTNISPSNLYKYAEGTVLPKLTSVISICKFFDIPMDYFSVGKSTEGEWYVFM